jgi:hypothetical protein
MNHDPLCPMTKGKSNPLWKAAAPIYDLLCECELIGRVRVDESSDCANHEIQIRKQTIDECIEAVRIALSDSIDFSAKFVAGFALKDLKEKL